MARFPKLRVRCNNNRQTLISLRRSKGQPGMTLSVHKNLLLQEDLEEAFADFIRAQGRGHFPLINQRTNAVFAQLLEQQHAQQRPAQTEHPWYDLPGHGGGIDLQQRLNELHQRYWPQLPILPIRWGKHPGNRRLRSIRFGSYRSQPAPQITIHPRLALAWVPTVFVDHVIHHELCHHAQYCLPLRGLGHRREAPHSQRFREWEAQFNDIKQAITWEKLRLNDLLNPTGRQQTN